MMHHLNMYAGQWNGSRYWWPTPDCLELGGTPLGQAAACALDFVPMYQRKTGVQKINTVFLTDGAGCTLDKIQYINSDDNGNDHNGYKYSGWKSNLIITTIFKIKIKLMRLLIK